MPTYKSSFWKSLSPGGLVHTKLISGAAVDRPSVNADAKTVAALDFDRIIPLHGVSIFNQYCLDTMLTLSVGYHRNGWIGTMEDRVCGG